jgi:hypothetical protein
MAITEQTNSKLCYTCGQPFTWSREKDAKGKFIRLGINGQPHNCSKPAIDTAAALPAQATSAEKFQLQYPRIVSTSNINNM